MPQTEKRWMSLITSAESCHGRRNRKIRAGSNFLQEIGAELGSRKACAPTVFLARGSVGKSPSCVCVCLRADCTQQAGRTSVTWSPLSRSVYTGNLRNGLFCPVPSYQAKWQGMRRRCDFVRACRRCPPLFVTCADGCPSRSTKGV